MTRLLADANMSHRFVAACIRLERDFPLLHIADWMSGRHRMSQDLVLLQILREQDMVLVSFDRRSIAMHAGQLTREGLGHAGVILFRRIVSQLDYGKQSRSMVTFWGEARNWDWTDRIEYLP